MIDALIGHSGYVGSTLLGQRSFQHLFRSNDIATIASGSYGQIVCAGAPAQKWIANREPEADRAGISRLIGALAHVRCDLFVLVSTVDVFAVPVGVTEASPIEKAALTPYGANRRELEEFVMEHFPRRLIVRLPGLVGPNLRKNIVYDFHNGNNLQAIDSRAIFQFYPMTNLWRDIEIAVDAGLELVHLAAEPVNVSEVARAGFGLTFVQALPGQVARYDMRSLHSALYGSSGAYQYSREASLGAIRAYAESEPRAKPAAGGAAR